MDCSEPSTSSEYTKPGLSKPAVPPKPKPRRSLLHPTVKTICRPVPPPRKNVKDIPTSPQIDSSSCLNSHTVCANEMHMHNTMDVDDIPQSPTRESPMHILVSEDCNPSISMNGTSVFFNCERDGQITESSTGSNGSHRHLKQLTIQTANTAGPVVLSEDPIPPPPFNSPTQSVHMDDESIEGLPGPFNTPEKVHVDELNKSDNRPGEEAVNEVIVVKFRSTQPERPAEVFAAGLNGMTWTAHQGYRMNIDSDGPPLPLPYRRRFSKSSSRDSSDSIQVCVADITSAEDSETSSECDSDPHSDGRSPLKLESVCEGEREETTNRGDREGQMKRESRNMQRSIVSMTPERYVPQEYSSSPIVEVLANSVLDERPSPPGYCNPEMHNEPAAEEIRLLDMVVRTHPIWYLKSLNRTQATHILRPMEAGTFLVRQCSKPGSMALSIRAGEKCKMDVEHFVLIESRNKVRDICLESSPHKFRSLPELITHYIDNDDELQTPLRLPTAIRSCTSVASLCSLALMGQDFWSSPMATLGVTHHSRSSAFFDEGGGGGQREMSKKRPSSTRVSRCSDRLDPLALSTGERALHRQDDAETPSPPSKHERVSTSHFSSPTASPKSVRSPSVRSTSRNAPAVTVPKSPSLSTASKDSNRRSFLRSLFSFGNSEKQAPVNQLATCHYFVPQSTTKEKVKGSRSAYELQRHTGEETWQRATTNSSMRTFKGAEKVSPRGKSTSSSSATSTTPSIVPMRRERSDLSATSVGRLARHLEGSPGPAQLSSSPRLDSHRVPLKPPQNALDPNAMRNCVEELRRKRLQTTDEMLHPMDVRNHAQHYGNHSPQVAMRPRVAGGSWRGPSREQRMSVPNMVDQQVMHSARAIKEKMGRNVDGELSTINEGLVTPVVRRKQFTNNKKNVNNDSSHSMSTESSEHEREERNDNSSPPSGTVSRGRETLQALLDGKKPMESFGRRYHSERTRSSSRPPAPVDGFWRQGEHGAAGDSPSSRTQQPQFFPQKAGSSWSAVTGELKSRQNQKIATVRPTPKVPHHRSTNSSMTVKDTVAGPPHAVTLNMQGRPSEYAQLSELSAMANEVTNSLLGAPKDDDAVSVAGTVFNEPWDSNVWENLLDLAHHGDDKPGPNGRLNETITEEDDDSDSDRTASSRMHDSEEDDDEHNLYGSMYGTTRRKIPSDHVTNKGWEGAQESQSRFSTLDSRLDSSISGSLRRGKLTSTGSPQHSMHSLPRAVSRFSECQVGSLDDLPTQMPTLSPLLDDTRKKGGGGGAMGGEEPGAVIQGYVEKLSENETTVFGATLRRFIECTMESEECDPQVVVRNVRQFLNGIKNYLVKHGEGELHKLIDSESTRLNANQILNIDAILEAVLHKILLRPIKPHLYHLMVKEQSKTGALQSLSANLGHVRALSLRELGFKNVDESSAPSHPQMDQIKLCLRKMQHHYSPLKKLENLLRAISYVIQPRRLEEENIAPMGTLKKNNSHGVPPADELVRWLVYILARSSTVGCEVEAWYMWELLPQRMLTGDAAYYLTALFSAVHVLKNADAIRKLSESEHGVLGSMTLSRTCSTPSSTPFVNVAIPDELNGSIRYFTFPTVQMSISKLSQLVAYQQGVTNPEEYGLYIIGNGMEKQLSDKVFPGLFQSDDHSNLFIVYKRHDAKIAWPMSVRGGVANSPAMTSQLAI